MLYFLLIDAIISSTYILIASCKDFYSSNLIFEYLVQNWKHVFVTYDFRKKV